MTRPTKRALDGGVEPATTRPVPETAQAAAYRRRDPPRLSASRTSPACSSSTPTTSRGRPGLAVRPRLRGRLAEDLAPAGPERRSSRPAAASWRAPGRGDRCRPRSPPREHDLAPMRARRAPTGPGCCSCRDDAIAVVTGKAAGGQPRPAGTSRPPRTLPAGISSRSRSSMRRSPGGPSSGSACPSWCAPPSPQRRCRLRRWGPDGPAFLVGAVDDVVRREGPDLDRSKRRLPRRRAHELLAAGLFGAVGGGDRLAPRGWSSCAGDMRIFCRRQSGSVRCRSLRARRLRRLRRPRSRATRRRSAT